MENLEIISNKALVTSAKNLAGELKKKELHLLTHLKEIKLRKLHILMGFHNLASFCVDHLEISEDRAWRLSQAINVVSLFPKAMELLKDNKTHLTHLSLLSPHITPANSDVILDRLPGLSKRELEGFLSQVQGDGSLRDAEAKVEITLRLPLDVMEKLERAQGLLQKGSEKNVTRDTVIHQALEALLDKKDPVRKAERASIRQQKKHSQSTTCTGAGELLIPSTNKPEDARSRYIPAQVRHQVYQSQLHRCSYSSSDGRQCKEEANLQMDHKTMWCFGGEHAAENLRLLCPSHNRLAAAQALGDEFMQSWVL